MWHRRHSCHLVLLGHCSVGTFECWDIWKKKVEKKIQKQKLLRCGPDNKRTKEKRKTIKIKETRKFEKHFFFFKYFLCLTFSTLPSYFLRHFLEHFYPPLRNSQTRRLSDSLTHSLTHSQTECSTDRAAMSHVLVSLTLIVFLFSFVLLLSEPHLNRDRIVCFFSFFFQMSQHSNVPTEHGRSFVMYIMLVLMHGM